MEALFFGEVKTGNRKSLSIITLRERERDCQI